MTWARLAFRQQRWEMLLLIAGVALLAGAMLFYAGQLAAITAANPECNVGAFTPGCEAAAQQFGEMAMIPTQLINLAFVAPFGIGLILGVPLVAREIDHGTAQIAWTLSRSRITWLARRVAFAALVVIGLLAVLAVTSEILAAALFPNADLGQDFTWYGRRGGLLVVRGLAALGVGVLVGAMIGRLLPALLVGFFATALVFLAISLGLDRWNEAEAVAAPYGRDITGDLSLGERVAMENGEVVTFMDMQRGGVTSWAIGSDGSIYVPPEGSEGFEEGLPEEIGELVGRSHLLTIPAERYPELVAREAAVTGGVAVLLGLGSGVAVQRRRPS